MERLRLTLLEKHTQALEAELQKLRGDNQALVRRLKDTEERRCELVRALEDLLKQIRTTSTEQENGINFKKNAAYIAATTFLVMNK